MPDPIGPDDKVPDAELADIAALIESSPAEALERLRVVASREPDHVEALRLAGQTLRRLGDWARAARADDRAAAVLARDPALVEAGQALDQGLAGVAERLLKAYLARHPDNPAALAMLAALAAKIGRLPDAERLLRRTLDQLPSFGAARFDLALLCYRTGRLDEALARAEDLLAADADDIRALNLKASVLGSQGKFEEAIGLYERITAVQPDDSRLWLPYGNQLAALGREQESVAAYRRAIALDPSFGPVWWSLADLKLVRFDRSDAELMEAQLLKPDLSDDHRTNIHFALGKAYDDLQEPGKAFRHYVAGNRIRAAAIRHRPEEITREVELAEAIFTADFLAERSGWGADEPGPIFIVGMPRAGSTLVEQILASHPDIEGIAELANMRLIAAEVRERKRTEELDAADCEALGRRYLDDTRRLRTTDRPFFIDKNPNNWLRIGLIHLLLPRARIIDIRRNPLDCCVSNFRQLFARGQGFSYALDHMAGYYADYVRLMRHFDEVLPGRIHRVIYEDLVEDLETQVRALLDHVGVAFDPACLRFHETDRAVRTPSSLQVRQPINRQGSGAWRRYEPWLDPLRQALGPLVDDYRR